MQVLRTGQHRWPEVSCPEIVPVLVRKLRISKLAVVKVRLWIAAFCEYKVHMQMFDDQLVFLIEGLEEDPRVGWPKHRRHYLVRMS
jgi:hypothetical protein